MNNLYLFDILGNCYQRTTPSSLDNIAEYIEKNNAINYIITEEIYLVNKVYWDNGLKVIPMQPGPNYVFDYTTKTWTDPRTLQELKDAKREEINLASEKANKSFFIFAGEQIACDDLSRSYIDAVNGLVSLTGALPANWIGGWKTVANTYVSIPDVATWTQFYATMVSTGLGNFNHAQQLKATLDAALTKEEVNAIIW
jgi:hypothetical protein